MPLPLLPLAGAALFGLASLIRRRRQNQLGQATASAVGQAVNSAGTTPTNTVSGAATSQPNTAQTPAGEANTGRVEISPVELQRGPGLQSGQQPTQQPAPTQQQGGDPNLAARMGAESVARSRRRNVQQQQALSGQAIQ